MSQRNVDAIYPLSPAQQGMLFETLASPGSGIHLEQIAYILRGPLDAATFAQAWRELLARHAVLRTGFVWQTQEEPLQIVLRQVDLPLTTEDWRDLPPEVQEERLTQDLATDRQDDFKLQKAPLLRLRLLHTGEDTWTFVWTHHHILMDGWCRPLLLKELFAVYQALVAGQRPHLAPSLPYKEYIGWLRQQDLAAAETFWKNRLRDLHRPTALGRESAPESDLESGTEGIRQDHQGRGFGQLRRSLPEAETAVLKEFAQRHHLTLNTLVQGVWGLLLSRYSGQQEVVFGVTVAGRPAALEGIESTVGLFINTLPLAAQVLPGSPLGSWLDELQHRNAEMREFEHLASGQIQRWSRVPGALPLYESILVFENYPVSSEASRASGLSVQVRRAAGQVMGGRTRHPLTWLIACSTRMNVQLIYHRQRIDQASAEHMAEHFLRLLQQLTADPQQPLAKLLELVPDHQIPRLRALPQSTAQGLRGDGAMPPRNAIEDLLLTIWSQVLGRRDLDIHSGFFELGGHSQLALHLVSLVRQAFQLDLPLRALFDGPTVAEMGLEIARRKGLQEEYQEALLALPTIVPDPEHRAEPFPLTDVQQAYWIGRTAAFELGNVATHIYLESVAEEVDLERYTAAWRRLIARHDMLRAIISEDGQQRILPSVPAFDLEVLDLRNADQETIDSQLAAVRETMSHQVLPSDRWPLFEVRASRLRDGRVRFHISLDLLIGDAWSWRILFRELAAFYDDPEVALPPLQLSFRDYVLTTKALEDSALYERSVAYWRGRLDSLPPAPELPLERNPSAVETPRFVRRSRTLEAARWRNLQERALGRGLTPSGLLLAAFAEVLAVWSKGPRFTINLTLFNRLPLHPQVNQVIGDFTSLLLLAADLSSGDTFEERARRLQQQLWDDLDHRQVSGVWVQRELSRAQGRPVRGFMPVVFTSTLTFARPGQDPGASSAGTVGGMAETTASGGRGPRGRHPKRDGLPLKRVYSITQTPQVWLDHQVAETPDGRLRINWDAVEDLFPAGLLDDMFEAGYALLERLAAGDEAWTTQDLGLVPAQQLAERAQLNAGSHATSPAKTDNQATPPPETLLHTPFLAQVAQRPEQLAVVSAERRLSYREVDHLARRLGHRLRGLGARPDTLVAVVMDKGWQQVPAVLAVLAAGAAYLPLDAALPEQRLHQLLALGEVRLVLTQERLLDKLRWPPGIETLAVDSADFAAPLGDDDPLLTAPSVVHQSPQDLAYVLFTSGSTGVPKGVMIEHRSVVNTLHDIHQRFAVGPHDRVLALSALSFDLSVFDLFGVLAAGGTIVLPEARAARDPARWLDLLETEGVTLWNSVPALMQMLVEYTVGQGRRLPPTLRRVLLSGDWIPLQLPDRIRQLGEGVEVVSLGGATEASIWSILYPIATVAAEWKSIPYGRPMSQQSFHVLDERLQPRPLWVPGQLYIGGQGLARGYWRDQPTTQASFFVHPNTGERLYRTGDLGRYLPDGTIEFLGREDSQVKVQGWRIELGEIEAALEQHAAVKEAVVSALGPRHGDKHLAAWVVAEPTATPPRPAKGSRQRLELKMSRPALRPPVDGVVPVQLTRPGLDEEDLEKLYLARRSHREFTAQPIPLEDFGQLLSCLAQLRLRQAPLPKARYASAGSLYPVQVYLYVKPERVVGLAAGTYYYHPAEHHLVPLDPTARIEASVHAPVNRAIFNGSAFSLFLVAQMSAIQPTYGEASERYALLEAGAISQLLETSAPAQGMGLCQIGELDSAALRPLFDLQESHQLLHCLLGGGIDPRANTIEAFLQAAEEMRSLLELTRPQPVDGSPAAARRRPAPAAPDPQDMAPDPQDMAPDPQDMAEDLRRFLATRLPGYMIPSTFQLLDKLPLSANGKVDRASLPRLDLPQKPQGPAYVAPKSEMEQQVAALWREILHSDKVGVRDNFFDLGGNSVLMVRLFNRLRETLGREFPLVVLFEHPTIHSLVEYFNEERPASSAVEEAFARGARRGRRRPRS